MHSENAILDAMDSFSNEAGALMEEVYQYMIQYSLGTRLDKKSATCISSNARKGEREVQG